MIDLITGHQGVAHISAEQVSTINKSMMNGYGSGQIVRLKDGTISDGTLSVIVSTGYWRMDGYDMEIQESDTLLLDPVTNPGDSRIDIIFVELLQDIATGVQRCEYVIVQGEEDPAPSEPLAPTEPQNDTDRLILATPLCKCTVHDDDTMDFVDLTIEFDVQAGPRIFLGASSTWDDMSLDERAYYDNCEVIFDDGGPYHIFIYYASSDTLSPIAGDPGPAMAKTPKFATCNTSSGTAIKKATTLNNDFVLQTGAVVFVQFDYITATVTDPKLNVDNTGAKLIKAYGTTKPARWWRQGDIVQFVYDGTYWIMYPTSGQINEIDADITNLNASLSEKVIHESAANKTYANQLSELESYYNGLTATQKHNAYIVEGNGYIYRCIYGATGIFSFMQTGVSTTYLYASTLNLTAHTKAELTNNTNTNQSNTVNTNTLKLITIGN